MVYVLSNDNKPLMPTTRYGKVRRLLKENKAKVVNNNPFTIQLLYDSPEYTQPLTVGIDPGRQNIGIAVINEKNDLIYSANVETRNKKIKKLLGERRSYRQQRKRGKRQVKKRRAEKNNTVMKNQSEERILPGYKKPVKVKHIKNKEAKFSNRKRKDGWLTPTANHLLQTHINLIRKLQKILPIDSRCHINIEVNKFDIAKIDNPFIKNYQYSRGPLYNFKDLKSYISHQQKGTCLLCSNPIDHYHHIVNKAHNGSNVPENIAGLCKNCHTKVHTDSKYNDRLLKKKKGIIKKFDSLSVINQIMPEFLTRLSDFTDNIYLTDGYETKRNRTAYNLPKDHNIDAYAIALSDKDCISNINIDNVKPCHIVQFRRHNRQINHKVSERTYKMGKETVAKNRRKRTGQDKTLSLHDYYLLNKKLYGKEKAKQMQSELRVLKSTASKRNLDNNFSGTIIIHNNRTYAVTGTAGSGYYFNFWGYGTKNFKARDCLVIRQNSGLVYT